MIILEIILDEAFELQSELFWILHAYNLLLDINSYSQSCSNDFSSSICQLRILLAFYMVGMNLLPKMF